MAVDEKKPGPPQPILIQAGERTEPESVKAELQSAVPKSVEVRKGGGASQEAIDHYRIALNQTQRRRNVGVGASPDRCGSLSARG